MMRALEFVLVVLVITTWCVDARAQVPPPPNDLLLGGRVIGPLPLQYGQPSEFELTFTNLGPTLGRNARATATIPLVPPVAMYATPGNVCHAGPDVVSNPPDPVLQRLDVFVPFDIAVGETIVCRFRMVPTVSEPYPSGRSLTFTSSWDYFPFVDPDLSNNQVTLGLDPPSATSVPTLSAWWAAALALLVGLIGLRRP